MAKVKIGAWEIDEDALEQQHREALRRGERQAIAEPQAQRVGYDRNTSQLVVELNNGVTFLVPTNLLQGLAGAAPEDLEQVSLGPRGASLHWEKIEVDFSLAGLIVGILGTRAWMAELGKRGGRAKTEAKAAAAQANGKKGGRPEKIGQSAL
jgi:hypothetical protein